VFISLKNGVSTNKQCMKTQEGMYINQVLMINLCIADAFRNSHVCMLII